MARLNEPSASEIREAIDMVHLHHDVLQGPAGEIGLVAIVKQNNKTLYDEKEGLVPWRRDMQAFFYKAMGASFILSTLGALIGTLIMWWLTYRAGK